MKNKNLIILAGLLISSWVTHVAAQANTDPAPTSIVNLSPVAMEIRCFNKKNKKIKTFTIKAEDQTPVTLPANTDSIKVITRTQLHNIQENTRYNISIDMNGAVKIVPTVYMLPPTKAPLGATTNTYAPEKFQPSEKFADKGLIGNYFSSSKTATIHDPSGKNSTSYTFENVTPGSPVSDNQGRVLIGSFAKSGPCNGIMCSNVVMLTSLYGTPLANA